ncbi:hypothetical protein [Pontibacter sp. G13]|uniref:hypothetical protein n=1 Tax=Pontibacter sp. G13 TaxID=3074898 RepID=UPI00288B41C8|nr:hypothetical protein [Pontibacter sp. G13]WNJ18831.1 hypothetical protein RJD25_28580 [Pontibacter sp. G13]
MPLTRIVLWLGVPLLLVVMSSCASEEEAQDAPPSLVQSIDSSAFEIEEPEDLPVFERVTEEAPPIPKELPLIGKWHLVEMYIDGLQLGSEDMGKSSLEFTDDGLLVYRSEGLQAESHPYDEQNGAIISHAFEGPQPYKLVQSNTLVIENESDGVSYRYIYKKK